MTVSVGGRTARAPAPARVQHGEAVAPERTTGLFSRQPRTLIATAPDGVVTLVTVDGRQSDGVGVTLVEAARVAVSLGLTEVVDSTAAVRRRWSPTACSSTARARGRSAR